jgi:hypothetical protein
MDSGKLPGQPHFGWRRKSYVLGGREKGGKPDYHSEVKLQ